MRPTWAWWARPAADRVVREVCGAAGLRADRHRRVPPAHSVHAAKPENVFAVKRNAQGKTQVQALTEHTELDALRDYLGQEGSLGEYWRTFGLES
jgi:hypothetical protein